MNSARLWSRWLVPHAPVLVPLIVVNQLPLLLAGLWLAACAPGAVHTGTLFVVAVVECHRLLCQALLDTDAEWLYTRLLASTELATRALGAALIANAIAGLGFARTLRARAARETHVLS